LTRRGSLLERDARFSAPLGRETIPPGNVRGSEKHLYNVPIASRRRDDSLSRPATIWVVPSGEDLYVRSVNGPNCPAATVASSARRLAERMEAERQKGSYFV
jgi:Uncharacterized protein conserved in bacteria (DUF2255)